MTRPIEFFVSPMGHDHWPGRWGQPFATIERAQQAVRALKRAGKLGRPVRVVLRGGVYELKRPLVFQRGDSGLPPQTTDWNVVTRPPCDVTYAAYPGETPVLSGGRRITGWRETSVHGHRAWVARVPGGWNFTQLWVNGRRARRTRLPKRGLFRIEKLHHGLIAQGEIIKKLFTGQDRFRFQTGDLHAWRNVRDIEFVALHYWIEDRLTFRSINPRTREARLRGKSRMRLLDDFGGEPAQYYVENLFEELSEPGQWYHDRPTGQLYYLPRPGEKIETAEVVAPHLKQLLLATGVEHMVFDGLTFSHTEWVPGEELHRSTPQAACHLPGALSFRRSQRCAIRNCAIEHIGSYGLELLDESRDIEIAGNRITDLAGGGVKIWHSSDPGKRVRWAGDQTYHGGCRHILVADNEIADGGHRFHQAVGVLIGRCSANQVVHNHIHDFNYTGISVGWTWGYAEGHAYGNIIEYNHIHHIGRGVLSDMGAIYALGVSPGTRVRYNLIHDVESRGYGGWGIYPDEGSSHILIENNVVYRTKSGGFSQHYGRDNLVRNNIFALGREYQIGRHRLEPHNAYTFTGNIVYGDNGGEMLGGNWTERNATFDHNLYFCRKPLKFAGKTFRQWQRAGADQHSLIADPRFVAPERGDFRLKPGSPAAKIGFRPIDLSEVGPRRSRA